MKEIEVVGHKKQGGFVYLYSIFECPSCLNRIEKIKRDGLSAKFCSHKCYAKHREARGAYNENVMISGYLYKYMPSHPKATKAGYVAIHRLVAEANIGRYLGKDEIAHHKNEIKTDNTPSNIEVMTKSQHSKHHQNFRKCKIES